VAELRPHYKKAAGVMAERLELERLELPTQAAAAVVREVQLTQDSRLADLVMSL
jgi:hypothetical protein